MALPSAPVALAVPDPARDWRWPARVAGRGEPMQAVLGEALRGGVDGSEGPIELVIDPVLLGPGGLDGPSVVRLANGVAARIAATSAPDRRPPRVKLGPPDPPSDPFARPWPLDRGALPSLRPEATLPATPRLWLVPAEVDRPRWRGRPAVVRGSCEPLLAALGQAQGFALARLEPFLVRVDERLARSFRRELGREATARDRALGEEALGSERRGDGTCAAQRAARRRELEACLTGAECPLAPRAALVGSFVLGSLDHPVWSEAPCAPPRSGASGSARGGPDPELEAMARRASAQVAATLDADWAVFADRVAALGAVHDALDHACEARRRRFDPAGEAALRDGVRALFDGLRDPLVAEEGRAWRTDERSWPLPGRGELRGWQVLDTASGAGLRAAAVTLEAQVYARARCGGPFDADPVALVFSRAGKVVSSTLAYPEELVCAGVPEILDASDHR